MIETIYWPYGLGGPCVATTTDGRVLRSEDSVTWTVASQEPGEARVMEPGSES